MSGCKCPVAGGTPRASKLYALNDLVLHDPLHERGKWVNEQGGKKGRGDGEGGRGREREGEDVRRGRKGGRERGQEEWIREVRR